MANRIDQLLKEQETVKNTALKAALARQIEAEEKAQEEAIFKQFTAAKKKLTSEVESLRYWRKTAKEQEKKVKAFDSLLEAFKEDGDWNKFQKASEKIGVHVYV